MLKNTRNNHTQLRTDLNEVRRDMIKKKFIKRPASTSLKRESINKRQGKVVRELVNYYFKQEKHIERLRKSNLSLRKAIKKIKTRLEKDIDIIIKAQ